MDDDHGLLPFLVFSWDSDGPMGGFNDFNSAWKTMREARARAKLCIEQGFCFYQIVCLKPFSIMESFCELDEQKAIYEK